MSYADELYGSVITEANAGAMPHEVAELAERIGKRADTAIRAMSEEVEAAYREGYDDGWGDGYGNGREGEQEIGANACWAESDARARLKEAGHDDHE